MSASLHTALLLMLALVTYGATRPRHTLTLTTSLGQESAPEPVFLPRFDVAEPEVAAEEPEATPPVEADLLETMPLAALEAPQVVTPEALRDPLRQALEAVQAPAVPSTAALARLASSGGTRLPTLKAGASYFGIQATGQRFVFVVDASTSMWGHRWLTAVKELGECLAGLPPDCQFYVIFFSDTTQFLFGQDREEVRFEPASAERVQEAKQWISAVQLGHSTRPLLALRTAVMMEPDAIFLLSDGEFRDTTVQWVRMQVAGRTGDLPRLPPIHTVALMSRAGLAGLAEIARRTGGQFREIRQPH